MTKKEKKPVRDIPQLILTRKADPGCNNAFYTVRIPIAFMPKTLAAWYEYRFIGLKEDLKK